MAGGWLAAAVALLLAASASARLRPTNEEWGDQQQRDGLVDQHQQRGLPSSGEAWRRRAPSSECTARGRDSAARRRGEARDDSSGSAGRPRFLLFWTACIHCGPVGGQGRRQAEEVAARAARRDRLAGPAKARWGPRWEEGAVAVEWGTQASRPHRAPLHSPPPGPRDEAAAASHLPCASSPFIFFATKNLVLVQ